jgi:hypothetical protein
LFFGNGGQLSLLVLGGPQARNTLVLREILKTRIALFVGWKKAIKVGTCMEVGK